MIDLLSPKEIEIDLSDGGKKTFVISKFPAIEGREIICKYPTSALPKVGNYSLNEETMFKLMKYVEVKTDNGNLRLKTRELINNHIPDWEALGRIEIEMMRYNCSFFRNGKISSFLENITAKAQQLISSTLTASSGQSSQTAKQPTENSKKNTR